MSKNEINVAIAKAVGWKKIRISDDLTHWQNPKTLMRRLPEGLPDYCGDLNAMHEAETKLFGVGWVHYSHALLFDNIHATARQRAEAFLRTIGKWKTPQL